MPDERQKMLGFEAAFDRYESIRNRLPSAVPASQTRRASSLLDTIGAYDGYLFDSFGVLNVGDTAIAGAADVLLDLRARNIPFCVLTNAASYPSAEAFTKYQRLGLDVRPDEILSSREVLWDHLATYGCDRHWAAIATDADTFADSPRRITNLAHDVGDWTTPDGFLFLSAACWTQAQQDRLVAALVKNPRPVLVGNPDLVAPRETGLSIEPGFWAHDLQDRTGIQIEFFGKPFAAAFDQAAARIGSRRLAMIGDTLHTDILGGQACGLDTVLVSDHGLFAGRDVAAFINQSGIVPSWIVPSI